MEVFRTAYLDILLIVTTLSLLHSVPGTGNDQIIKDLISNVSQLRQESEAFAAREQELNRTIKLQLQEYNQTNQTIKLQLEEFNRTIAGQKRIIQSQENQINELRFNLETLEILLNHSLKSQPTNDDLKGLESKINQSVGAQDIIIHDIVDKINTQEKANNEMRLNISGQIRYMALSLLDVRKELDKLNVSDLEISRLIKSNLSEYYNLINRMNQSFQDDSRDVAFTVSVTTGRPLDSQKVIYDKVITNVGNGYSTHTGAFTCPRDGVYVFTWSTMSRFQNERCEAFIYRNGVQLLMTQSLERNGGVDEVASNSVVLSLTVGDKVWIQTTRCDYFYGYPYTAFSGWKL